MAKFTLTIETDDPIELADITAAIAEEQSATAPADLPVILHPEAQAVNKHNGVEQAPAKPKGRPPKAAASVAAATEATSDLVDETPGESSLSTTVSPSDSAADNNAVTAQDCKLALTAAMDRDVPPNKIQAALVEKFGAGSVMKIDPSRYAELKAYLESLQK